ncbi:MAG TPA: hypothetical protein VHL11_12905, partial [Phototrophicaceae bacterium]|nr:hypothetical protein [Phototrophicaceae bacterium]
FHRGLLFGVDNAVVEQFFFQQTRFARLLNVLAQPSVTPKIGIGVDGLAGSFITDRTTVGGSFGTYTTSIFDAESFGSAANAQFVNNILSIHDVVFHVLAPGTSTYDLTTRQVTLNAVPVEIPVYEPRSFDMLKLPDNAGGLILAGNLEANLAGNPVLTEFVQLSGGASANILIVADGYADDPTAQAAADAYAAALGVSNTIVIVGPSPVPAVGDFTGILLIGRDKTLITPASVATVLGTRWQDGTPVLADNAMATILGTWYANNKPTDIGGPNEALDTQGSMVIGNTVIGAGLGWIDASFESTVLVDQRPGRWISLAYNHPETLEVALLDDTALELTPQRTRVLGTDGVMLFDARRATLALGTNNAFVIANALVDTYATGETLPVNLLLNGGFDGDVDANKLPLDWKAKGMSRKDKVKVDKPDDDLSVDGSKAFVFKGEVAENSKLVQKLPVTGLVAGDTLQLSGYFRGKNVADGLTIQVKVKYVDSSVTASKITVTVAPGTFDYTYLSSSTTTAGVPLLLKTRVR